MNQKGLAPILIVLLIPVVLGGFLIYQKQQSNSKLSTQPEQKLQSPSQTQQTRPPLESSSEYISNQPKLEQTIDWRVYKNELYGFEIKYPKDWKIMDRKNLSEEKLELIYYPPERNVEAIFTILKPIKTAENTKSYVIRIHEDYRKALERIGNRGDYKLTEEDINGIVFQRVFSCSEACPTSFYVKKGDYLFEFYLALIPQTHNPNWERDSEPKLEQILINMAHTFKFLP